MPGNLQFRVLCGSLAGLRSSAQFDRNQPQRRATLTAKGKPPFRRAWSCPAGVPSMDYGVAAQVLSHYCSFCGKSSTLVQRLYSAISLTCRHNTSWTFPMARSKQTRASLTPEPHSLSRASVDQSLSLPFPRLIQLTRYRCCAHLIMPPIPNSSTHPS